PPLLVEELSGREREVLSRLAQLMSTQEIAADLYVSVNTVKTHLKSVYRKLGVGRRGDAVRRARERGLL
ncbi:helix-turn-helix transcriptional regulator, partial [Streptomyces sp. NPDC007162]|uniref:response regulator transcription factor n=1 Tax=Streptomyces sp. NPDC007162 TaxID=3156917 RepID=UPI00340FBCF1